MAQNRLLMLMMVVVLLIGSLYLSNVEARQLPVQQLMPNSLSWQNGPANLPQPAGDGVAFVLGSTLYHAGGWAGQIAQPINAVYANRLSFGQPGNWDAPTSMPGGGHFGAAAVTSDGRAYILGGYNGSTFLDRVDSFDGNSWRVENNLPQALTYTGAAVVGDRLYVGGGINASGKIINGVSSAPIAGLLGAWRTESPLPVPLFTRLAQWGACLYIVGGTDNSGQQRNEVYRATWGADGTITGWPQAASLPQPLARHQAVTRQGVLYVLGGETTGGGYSDKVYAAAIGADCALSSWSIEPMPNSQGRRRVAAAVEGLNFFLVGGQLADGRYTGETWYVPTPTPTPTSTPTVTRTPTPTPTATPTGFWAAWQEPGVSIPVPVSGSAAARFIYANNLEGAIPMTVTLEGWANFGPRGAKWFTDTLTTTSGTHTIEVWADAKATLGDTFALDVELGKISLPQRRGYVAEFVFLPLVLRR